MLLTKNLNNHYLSFFILLYFFKKVKLERGKLNQTGSNILQHSERVICTP